MYTYIPKGTYVVPSNNPPDDENPPNPEPNPDPKPLPRLDLTKEKRIFKKRHTMKEVEKCIGKQSFKSVKRVQ